jgi:hypothetical protein
MRGSGSFFRSARRLRFVYCLENAVTPAGAHRRRLHPVCDLHLQTSGIFQFSTRAGDASQEKPGFVWKTMYYGAMVLMVIGFSMKQGWLKV